MTRADTADAADASDSADAPLEVFLARLYADPAALDLYLRDPDAAIRAAGLDAADAAAMRAADRTGLAMAAQSCARKRDGRDRRRGDERR